MKKLLFPLLLLIALCGVEISKSYASHASGMDLFYRWTTGKSYEFTATFYRNCSPGAITAPGALQLYVRCLSLGIGVPPTITTAVTLSRLPTSGVGVPPLQPYNIYDCTLANLCYEEYVYRGTVNLSNLSPTPSAQDWTFFVQEGSRPNGAQAAANIAAGYIYVECGLNNKDFPDANNQNWSPLWHNRRPNQPGHTTDTLVNYLMRTVCEGNYYSFDMSVREYQGDSISYSLYWPQDYIGANIAYINGYCFTGCPLDQMPTNNGPISINPVSGIIPLVPGTPAFTGIYVIGIQATEWRYDTLVSGGSFAIIPKEIGYVRRDMTIWIDPPSTCRRDSVHPKDISLTNGGGDTILNVFFHTGKVGDPNSLVRCGSLSPDGSEFRLIDSTNYIAPFDTTARSIGINRAEWACNAGLTGKVTLYLAEPLRCQKYTIMLKKGSDLDVIESECGFLEPEFKTGKLIVSKNVQVKIDTLPLLSYCLPTTNPFPKLKASSTDSSSFPLSYFWAFNNDTVEGQTVPYIWANQPGQYKVMVRDPLNCAGNTKITVYFDTVPGFKFSLDPYCHKYGEPFDLPDFIAAPNDPSVKKWEWFTSLGKMGEGDTLRTPQLLKNMTYTLRGTKDPIAPGAMKCSYEDTFTYDSANFPPLSGLWVDFLEDKLALCLSDDDTGKLVVWEEGIRKKYEPFSIQWYYYNLPIPGNKLSRLMQDTGMYQVHVEDTMGCWGRDTAFISHDERLPAPYIPCEVTGALGTFRFQWEDPYAGRIEKVEVSLNGGASWEQSPSIYEYTVQNIQSQRGLAARGIVSTACWYTQMGLSEQCPDKVFPPNVITPNGDGLNDFFDVRGLELFFNNKVELEIYDRWGNRVYASSDYRNDWDGGKSPEGTYYFILHVKDGIGTIHKGVITLLR